MKVGLIGCGRIAREAHLPAYKKYGVTVSAVCDLIEDRAKACAESYGVKVYCTDVRELASRDDVELIDVATRPIDRDKLLISLLPFKKPILVQKPIVYDYQEAEMLEKIFKNESVPIAINHNARWSPVQNQLSKWIKEDVLGDIYAIHHVNRFNENIRAWYTDHLDYMFLDHGLHYIDLIRYHTNRLPVAVSGLLHYGPNQNARCPLIYSINMRYDGDRPLAVSLYFNNIVSSSHAFHCDWFVDGTKSSAYITIDSIARWDINGDYFPLKKLQGDWVPDGFIGAYSNFVEAIYEKREPVHSIKDHLRTLKIAQSISESARKNGEWVFIDWGKS